MLLQRSNLYQSSSSTGFRTLYTLIGNKMYEESVDLSLDFEAVSFHILCQPKEKSWR